MTYRNDKDGINRNGLRGIGSLEPLGIGTESNIQADRHVGASEMRRDRKPPEA